ncbi:MAG: hypothetical protein LW832_04330 [Parachlamydia sp.]|jgi:hypothetical protein|nr:hypothetical protein [Parachlamydia sp.]
MFIPVGFSQSVYQGNNNHLNNARAKGGIDISNFICVSHCDKQIQQSLAGLINQANPSLAKETKILIYAPFGRQNLSDEALLLKKSQEEKVSLIICLIKGETSLSFKSIGDKNIFKLNYECKLNDENEKVHQFLNEDLQRIFAELRQLPLTLSASPMPPVNTIHPIQQIAHPTVNQAPITRIELSNIVDMGCDRCIKNKLMAEINDALKNSNRLISQDTKILIYAPLARQQLSDEAVMINKIETEKISLIIHLNKGDNLLPYKTLGGKAVCKLSYNTRLNDNLEKEINFSKTDLKQVLSNIN